MVTSVTVAKDSAARKRQMDGSAKPTGDSMQVEVESLERTWERAHPVMKILDDY